jgi:hypothetical protein
MCDCITRINKKLKDAGHNTRLAMSINFSTGTAVTAIQTVKEDSSNRKKPVNIFPTFCPFCAERYEKLPEAQNDAQAAAGGLTQTAAE